MSIPGDVADPRGGYRVAAASDERADLAELFQSFEEEGPALDVLASREPLTVDLASADARWPAFAPAAGDMEIGWVHAVPICLGSEVVGALNLFRPEAGGDVPGPGLGRAVCGLMSIALAQERPTRRTERLAEHIAQAVGVLMARHRCGPEQAFPLLLAGREHGEDIYSAAARIGASAGPKGG